MWLMVLIESVGVEADFPRLFRWRYRVIFLVVFSSRFLLHLFFFSFSFVPLIFVFLFRFFGIVHFFSFFCFRAFIRLVSVQSLQSPPFSFPFRSSLFAFLLRF
ncbi:hypothetical protein SERLA73DRAFT_185792 [Serpula lacrymans var. lacrymans S7.3]|uniref:Uncharacterized protein n=1 Tax=Serpula lacrymans var. lacrymans (strain S7.3) TaxID=936435 RepID=F8Q6E2_SERL3|nr:hypothetical protein SERLA73DRAFT_185792 [Serpula lacrymans var. lacrymans S7.3]